MRVKIYSFILFFSLFYLSASAVFALPSGYGSIRLGMTVDEVKAELKKDRDYGFRGDRDVSLVPSTKQTLIETDGSVNPYSFFERCWFQFDDDRLSVITINLNTEKIDHYSVFSSLCNKYGNPDTISPEKSVWNDDKVIMSLERPLALKYIDAEVFDSKINDSKVQKTAEEQSREQFLDGL